MTRLVLCLAALVGAGAAVWPVEAHHSVLGFDTTRGVTLRGVVHAWVWNNPHTHITVDVTDGPERGRRWIVESESPIVLRRLGWSPASLRAGDRVVVIGAAASDGRRLLRCQSVMPPGGERLACYPAVVQ